MKTEELAAAIAVIIVVSIAVGGLALYVKKGGNIKSLSLPSFPSVPTQRPGFSVSSVYAITNLPEPVISSWT